MRSCVVFGGLAGVFAVAHRKSAGCVGTECYDPAQQKEGLWGISAEQMGELLAIAGNDVPEEAVENATAFLEGNSEWVFGRRGEPATCGTPIAIRVTEQPWIGMGMAEAATDAPMTFGEMKDVQVEGFWVRETHKCSKTYQIICEEGVSKVRRTMACNGDTINHKITEIREHEPFKICPGHDGKDFKVQVPMVDLIWHNDYHAAVEGCVEVGVASEHETAAFDWDNTKTMVGDARQGAQRGSVHAYARKYGGCVTYQKPEDWPARGSDFAKDFGFSLRMARWGQNKRAVWFRNEPNYTKWSKWTRFQNKIDLVKQLAVFGSFHGNRTLAFNAFAWANCGEPETMLYGPQFFRYEDVVKESQSLTQKRGYFTATMDQTEDCFMRNMVLFQSSDSPQHRQARDLYDRAGMLNMHEGEMSAVEGEATKREEGTPDGWVVTKQVAKLILEKMLGVTATEEQIETVAKYDSVGKLCVFGSPIKSLGLLSTAEVAVIRNVTRGLVSESPFGAKIREIIAAPEFDHLRAMAPAEDHMQHVADGTLFAGVLGTNDMTYKCIKQQFEDPTHVPMFRSDNKKYLYETMRLDGAVTSITSTMSKETTFMLEGYATKFPAGTPQQVVYATANRDPNQFANPNVFDMHRANLDDMITWNGQLKHVKNRDYSKAPRFCPGHDLSVRVAAAVCAHFTQHL